MRKHKALFSFLLLLLCSQLHAAVPGVYAITGGTVHPVSGPPIENGVVLIRSGLIEAVGAGLAIPADATVIDAKGQHVYPGLFDAQTSVGLPAAPRRRRGGPPGQQQQRREEAPQGPTPSAAYIAAQNLNLTEEAMDARRGKGVTTVLVSSGSDIFNGQSAILNLAGDTPQSMLIKTPASMQISFNPRDNRGYPGSLMGVITFVRQTLMDAQQNEIATGLYARNPAGRERPTPSPDLEALRSVLRRDLPVVFVASDELMIRRAAEIAREFNLRWIISGARQAYRMGDFFKQAAIPVLVSMDFPKPPTERREDQPLRTIRDRVMGPTGPAELKKQNIPFALVSAAASPADFIRGIRKTIEKGLDEESALRAVTLSPAQIFGVDRQIGSLERGKIANVFITDKKFFEREVKVKELFIDGRRISVPEEEEAEEGAPSPAAGTWSLTVRATEGELAFQVVLQVEGDRLSGTFSGDRGSGDIRDGSIEDNTVRFTITARATEMGETDDWKFEGTITGRRMEGTVSTNVGTFQFTGSKPQ